MIKYTAIVLLFTSLALAETPDWISTRQLKGNIFTVSCNGNGMSLSQAREMAQDDCRISASDQMKTTFRVKTLSVEDEKQVGYHQEVISEGNYKGLKCIPKKESINVLQNGFSVWELCEFDLAQAHYTTILPEILKNGEDFKKWIQNYKELSQVQEQKNYAQPGRTIANVNKILLLTTVPQCDNLIIRSSGPGRIVGCWSDLMTLKLNPEDTEIIVRAEHYQPKTIKIGGKGGGEQSVQVFLEPLR